MATINTFEDLGIWQKAREICSAVWALTQVGTFAKDFSLHTISTYKVGAKLRRYFFAGRSEETAA